MVASIIIISPFQHFLASASSLAHIPWPYCPAFSARKPIRHRLHTQPALRTSQQLEVHFTLVLVAGFMYLCFGYPVLYILMPSQLMTSSSRWSYTLVVLLLWQTFMLATSTQIRFFTSALHAWMCLLCTSRSTQAVNLSYCSESNPSSSTIIMSSPGIPGHRIILASALKLNPGRGLVRSFKTHSLIRRPTPYQSLIKSGSGEASGYGICKSNQLLLYNMCKSHN